MVKAKDKRVSVKIAEAQKVKIESPRPQKKKILSKAMSEFKVKIEKGLNSKTTSIVVKDEMIFPPPPMGFKKVPSDLSKSPFPDFVRPSDDEILLVVSLLGNLHGMPTPGTNIMPVLDSIVRTILSQNTTDKISRVAFQNLKSTFNSWMAV